MRGLIASIALALGWLFIASTASAADPDWKQDWDKTVAAANKEGELVISSPVGKLWSDFLTARFKKDYPGITLKMTPAAARDFWVRFANVRGGAIVGH